LLIGLFSLGLASAQINIQNEVLSTAGNTFSTSTYQVDFTLGEVFTSTLSSSTGTVYTQGFQQPSKKKFGILDPVLVSLEENVPIDFQVFPNPFRGEITIEVSEYTDLAVQLYDNTGRLVHNENLAEIVTTIDLSRLSVGNYQMILQSKEVFLGRISLIKSH
jgi:hypothetical protein